MSLLGVVPVLYMVGVFGLEVDWFALGVGI